MLTRDPGAERLILVVDDEPAIVTAVTRLLGGESLHTVPHTDSEQALASLDDTHYAVIITDNRMPKVTGLDLLRFAMARSPNSRRILVTGYSDLDAAIEAFNSRVIHRYVHKPWRADEFLQVLREELATYEEHERQDSVRRTMKSAMRLRSAQLQQALEAIRQADHALEEDFAETGSSVSRRLAAIIIADVVGYSRLMGHDPHGTLDALQACREIWAQLTSHWRGRLVNTPGDGLLAEFTSAADAVECALEVQQALLAQNRELPIERQMQYRIGVTVGEVLEQGGSLYGNGINVAARLQSLAAPGEVWISQSAYEFAGELVEQEAEFMGEQHLHNIAEPVRAYRLRP